jgi:hypothetical protein
MTDGRPTVSRERPGKVLKLSAHTAGEREYLDPDRWPEPPGQNEGKVLVPEK